MAQDLHFEPFVHLAGLDDDQALVAWGGFWFRACDDGRGHRTVDDEDLSRIDPGRTESIGARSQPYGHALVEARGPDGGVAARAETDDANHVWLRGLEADTEYRYVITIDGEPWARDRLHTWKRIDAERGELVPASQGYDMRFRTLPDLHEHGEVVFCAIGDFGIGIHTAEETGSRQSEVAHALARAVDRHDVRLVVTLGDNIYHQEGQSLGGSGQKDDDWYFSFYEPYRWVLSRVPFFPAVGNHDAAETEKSDDRGQLADNYFTDLRFRPKVEEGRASVDPGLFYRLDYNRSVSFLCIDTSEARSLETERFFSAPEHRDFVEATLADDAPDRWTIPFCHHPPFCAGPKHHNDEEMLDALVPLFERYGVRLVLSGHEHNFQYSSHEGVHYVVSGAGGKLRSEPPDGFEAAHTRAWAAEGHFLLVEVDGEGARVWPLADVADDGTLRCIEAVTPDGSPFALPIRIDRRDGARAGG